MIKRHVQYFAVAGLFAGLMSPASAQDTIKIGELNSYKAQPAFLDPYKKGWEMAIEEINAKGGVLGKKLEVISRDDGANPGEAVRVAEELVTREGVAMIAGTFLSHIGLAVTNFAGQKKVFFLAAEPLTDKITWQNGNKYTYRLRATTYMQVAMLMPAATAAKKKRWALVYPNFEYGQSAAENFKTLMKKAQPDVEFVTEQAPPLGKIDAGAVAQAIDDAKPDAIFNVLFGGDLAKFVREGNTRGVFKNRTVVSLLSGEPEYLDPAEGRSSGRLGGYRLSLGQDQDQGASRLRRCLQEEIQRLSATRLDRRLRDDEVSGGRHRQGKIHGYREAGGGLQGPQSRQSVRTVRLSRKRSPGDDGRLCWQDRAGGRQGDHGGLQIRRRRVGAAIGRRSHEAAAGGIELM